MPCPTTPQINFFRILIAIAAGSFAATIPGAFKVDNKLISATSSLGVFAFIYLINPAGWTNSDCGLKSFKAMVYIDNKIADEVEIIIPDIGKTYKTDELGSAVIEYTNDQIQYPTKIIFRHKSDVDTIIECNKPITKKMIFNLVSKKLGNATISDRSINYNFNGLNFNITIINQIEPAKTNGDTVWGAEDCVTYKFSRNNDTIRITPTSNLLEQINNNEIVDGFTIDDDIMGLDVNQPQLDIKITNNSPDALFFNQLSFNVFKSFKNNKVMLVPGNMWGFSLYNFGWGNAKNVRIKYSTTTMLTEELNWNMPFEDSIEVVEIKAGEDISFQDNVVENLSKKGVNRRVFSGGDDQIYFDPENKKERIKGKKIVGDFIDGAVIYGIITFTDENNQQKQEKFETYIDVMREGYGSGFDISSNYNTEFKVDGANYSIVTPISNAIKSKDFERISLTLASKQSSMHYFKLSFHYENMIITLPYIFTLDYFNTFRRIAYMRKSKNNIAKKEK